MLAANSFPAEFTGEKAHLKSQQQALLSRHSPVDLVLDRLRRRMGVGKGHKEMVAREKWGLRRGQVVMSSGSWERSCSQARF